MGGIHFGGRFISFQKLQQLEVTAEDSFQHALGFCKNYLNLQQEYPIKTSGSTGKPKTIVLKRDQLKSSAYGTIDALDLRSCKTALVCIPTEHIGGKMMLVRGMELDLDLYLIPPATQLAIKDLPVIDFVALVPPQLHVLLEDSAGRQFLNNCQAIIIGGGPLNANMEEALDQLTSPVYHTFGMTETVSHIALKRINGSNKSSSYQALPGVQLSLDARGCLVVQGKVTDEKPVTTNDLVQLSGERSFRWLGRWDRAINTGGHTVIPEQIESTIAQCLIDSKLPVGFVIVALSSEKWGEQVTLVMETEELPALTEAQLFIKLKEVLQPHQVPKSIRYFMPLPRTLNGKYDFAKIEQRLKDHRPLA